MIGYFRVVDKKTKDIIQYYKYSAVNSVQKQAWRSNPNIEFICDCNDKNLEVKISSDLRIYPAEQKVGHLHEVRCPKYIHFVPVKLWTRQHTETHIYFNVASHEAVAKDYLEKINGLTHYRLTNPENRMPDNYKEFIRKEFVTTKYIKTPNGEVLYDMAVSNHRNIKEWPVFKEYFICGEVVDIIKTSFSESMYYVDIADSFEKRYRFYVERLVLESLISLDRPLAEGKYFGGGFVYKRKANSSILTFSDFGMLKMNSLGLISMEKE